MNTYEVLGYLLLLLWCFFLHIRIKQMHDAMTNMNRTQETLFEICKGLKTVNDSLLSSVMTLKGRL